MPMGMSDKEHEKMMEHMNALKTIASKHEMSLSDLVAEYGDGEVEEASEEEGEEEGKANPRKVALIIAKLKKGSE